MTESIQSLRIKEAELSKTSRDLMAAESSAAGGIHLRSLRQTRGEIAFELVVIRREILNLEKSAKRKSRAKTTNGDKK